MAIDQPVLIYDRIASNRRKTLMLMVLFFIVVAVAATSIGIIFGRPPGLAPIVMLFVAAFALFAYFGSDRVALAVSGAKEITAKEQEPELFRVVENLCIGAGLPMP